MEIELLSVIEAGDTQMTSSTAPWLQPHGEWNRFVIVCDEDRIEVYYNGVKVNEAFNVSPSRGRVQLEAEQAEYFVRKWELELLD